MTTPRKLSARYDLGEILGFGGMSEVHLARDLRLSRDVAIKVLRADLARDPTFYLRFRREAQNAAALNHPAIVAVYDTGEAETEAGPLPFIVMEYVDGDTLRDIVRAKGPMTPRKAMEVIADVCAALDFSHRNGIVHRDMKPANIMINKAGAVKVMDFGIARAIADSSSPMTQTAAVIGTAQYLSPEQARGEQVDARSDVYSVGCVLFEILTAEPPFKGDSPVAVAYQHVREDPPMPSSVHEGVPRELDSVILKAMSKNPANRYQSAAEMRSDLIRVLGGQRPVAPTIMTEEDRTTILGGGDPPPRRHRAAVKDSYGADIPDNDEDDDDDGKRRGLRITAMIVAALLVVAFVGVFLWFKGPGSRPDQVEVPNVAEKSVSDAEALLTNAGFDVNRVDIYSCQGKPGDVISTKPLSGSRNDEGSEVTLEVSKGPQMVKVPSLLGKTKTEAEAEAGRQGMTLAGDTSEKESTRADVGKVVVQTPAANTIANSCSPIELTLGTGPAQLEVNNVVGRPINEASAALDSRGFVVVIEEVVSQQPVGEVVSTDPPGGTQKDRGSTVTVRVSKGDTVPMPDLLNQDVGRALELLRAAGWAAPNEQLIQTQEPTLDRAKIGKVVTQQFPPGSPLPRNGPVAVSIGIVGIPR
ncbi:Stk1 family PASTA domain-containing Ser/Thr kinase [Antrihabitans sp. YC2-6]|uniref:Stk1 family PASTA domain-containing Ser/Thr kinase n=1 Tax=Antrihabitans sp. YC2-6 TaxID=2799498 RepID=UPI0018F77480|nr:Stk1 family PASTA domain-containing Ser/Thr kinase [Antrihabitans sp. YC2-6]MBJ8346409.1 Stk1 family PASTA domain-containing Ser/Thr kinase [Antrihabitans sp. YC2-6]